MILSQHKQLGWSKWYGYTDPYIPARRTITITRAGADEVTQKADEKK